jgi:hypothetical protein
MKIIEQRERVMKNLIFIFFAVYTSISLYSQEIPAQLLHGFQTGNADELSVHFNERFQLTILSVDYRISKTQATEILRDFFKKYPPTAFSILFKGEKKESNWVICRLVTQTNIFRVTISFRKINDTNLIHLLEIEKENDTKL